ncbi:MULTISPECIES: FMN-binding protein MioC [Tatumella]|uniref:FMN-binding protein MioC n=1 Tax=Tatumella punctata TaxID=399969 RepID=A0ABW1VN23_9GAMM|nr:MULTISPECIES: FMN-binding protein MioC [unclassified Tatumella]MBS0857351.1 FMN-binding protein MioC [Tatumella sp. JGM16]MBS0878740.1 FMN-binding protein MioC [Tatumella sp. JGM82]MBS0892233.1 FMN-binding protein MioC [Tatumella sp. JGM94]MBS0894927.1 FMN-binding protein MioC [Tatumella sp. JGM130]MBS0903363.1 FMN-binding protein MioC [Tatumella sp. JGM100]
MADITFITGSTLGSAEYVAEELAALLEQEEISSEILHGPALDDLPVTGTWLLITSTHGAGEVPDNLLPFFEQLKEQQPDLSAVRYGAIGLGNHEYDLFCGAIRSIDQLLQSLGATRIGDRLEIDVLQHDVPEDPASEWLADWKSLI